MCNEFGKKLKVHPAIPTRRSAEGRAKGRADFYIRGPGIKLVKETYKGYGFSLSSKDSKLLWVPNRALLGTEGEDSDISYIRVTLSWARANGLAEEPTYEDTLDRTGGRGPYRNGWSK